MNYCNHNFLNGATGMVVRDTPLGAGFVDIFIGQIHSENEDQFQYITYQIDDNDLLDYSV